MYSDFHVHSRFSFDSDEDPNNNILKAIDLGMDSICFTEHMDIDWPVEGEDATFDYDDYSNAIDLYRNRYRDKIKIYKGVELGLWEKNIDKNIDYLKNHDFDYVIGSCHLVNDMDPYYPKFWEKDDEDKLVKLFLSTTLNCLKDFSNVNTLGHLDYIIRYATNLKNNYRPCEFKDLIYPILEFIKENDIALEINTGNFKSGLDFPNPHYDIWDMYKEIGGKFIQIGSDAHSCNYVGQKFDLIAEKLAKYDFEIIR